MTGYGAALRSQDLKKYKALIAGEQCDASSGETIEMICPSTGMPFATIPRCSAADVGRAVSSAEAALHSQSWVGLSAGERGKCLYRLSELLFEHRDDLAHLEARDTGKPLSQGYGDIDAAIAYFRFYAGAADKITGETLPIDVDYLAMTVREPHGVVASIVPWNYPMQIFARVAGAALAMGNSLVVKPSEDACLSIIETANLALKAGFPAGIINVLTGLGEEAGAALSYNPQIGFITFTGSPDVGTMIQSAAARNHIGCTLELGGKSPQIVFEDADLNKALPVIQDCLLKNGGQTCSAGSRVLVHESRWEEAVDILRSSFRSVVSGQYQDDRDLGPLINASQLRRVNAFCEQAEADEIPLIGEGTIAPDAAREGYYTTAKVYGPVPINHPLAQDEVFGPVLAVIPFRTEEEAVSIANATPYGLVAGVWTKDIARATRVAKAIRSGQVFINTYGAGGGVELPFGGVKKSGHGKEKGFEALKEFSVLKTIVISHA
ncbi:Aldehyde dehydrogenase PuuC [Pseudovibrio axinellae]|uniref:Aldehyde dehydrogenase PuuC n=1 Tax=Pseudovibrio axinellae TaxID=989403 RepID=A0A165U296_9HYPH|nr:aldehyde dehydrogenase family protein [Pseudovibrio axinellae]KZL09480.1 Aldehyde dehydrogenase PuuC [Pseudovibrio axinellae]SEQ63541.1 aldehyde dehydrogenase (NAD+) [Pseudovibrio axinellae]